MTSPAFKNFPSTTPTPPGVPVTKTSPASELIKQHAGLAKGSENPLRNKVGELSREALRKIAETKLSDLNAADVDAAMRIIEGTARSMGITVAD